MQEKHLAEKLLKQPLTINQIYQEYPFENIDNIDTALRKLRSSEQFVCNCIDGYYQVSRKHKYKK